MSLQALLSFVCDFLPAEHIQLEFPIPNIDPLGGSVLRTGGL